jgi:CRISPR type III-B/RAMP module-associated protein Cmr5
MALHSNLELARLSWSNDQVSDIIKNEALAPKYRALTRKLPSMIQTNGILNTLLFLKGKAKGDNEHQKLLIHLISWSQQTIALIDEIPNDNWIPLLLSKKSAEVRQITREYLMLAGYLKRVAEALIEEETKQTKKDNSNVKP